MKNKLYITTAIPYVNGKPHIGNALDYLIADIWARYQRQNGKEVKFQAGTDEHGNKIALKAAELKETPKEYTDSTYVNFKNLLNKMEISYTDFVRTTDAHHIKTAQYVWTKLKPYIYKGSYEGWYDTGNELFATDKEVEINNGISPNHNIPYIRLKEDNYYFKASAFTDQIKSAIESGKMEILPEFRKNEFLELIKDGLKDVSISRPKKNLSWGIPVPGDPEQVMYVWIDALTNYISVIGYPDDETWQEYWPADVQVIGKDILRFHAGLWSAILLGLGLPLPKRLLVHGFVNVNGNKMSKTIGNVVDPNEIIDNYGLDAFRYFFARHIPTQDDGDFTWEKFETAYNDELGNDLGNLVQRIAGMINKYQAGVIGDSPEIQHDTANYRLNMSAFNFNGALDEIWLMVRSLNQYIDDVKPWGIAKSASDTPDAKQHLSDVLAYTVGAVVQIGDLLMPFMPDTANKIKAIFSSGVVKFDNTLFPRINNYTKAKTKKDKA